MISWLKRALERMTEPLRRRRFFRTVDAMNAQAGGGYPTVTTSTLGTLLVPSGKLALADPMYVPGLEVSIAADTVLITAVQRLYPSGELDNISVELRTIHSGRAGDPQLIGEIPVDSAQIVIADRTELDTHWVSVGEARVGIISTVRDDTLRRTLVRKFGFSRKQVSITQAEVIGPVSESLEQEINEFLQSDPRYAKYPFMHFRVRTNNSFERVNSAETAWGYLPIRNSPEPLLFRCTTGRGDGCYQVKADLSDGRATRLSIQFIDD